MPGREMLLAGEAAERRAVERERRQREERLNRLFNSVPVGLAVVDANLRYLRVNEMLARVNGLPVEEHKGRTIHEVVPNIAAAVESVIRETLKSQRPILNLEVVGEVFAAPGQQRRWILFFIPLGEAVAVLVEEAGAGSERELKFLKDLAAALAATVESLDDAQGGGPRAPLELEHGVQFYDEVIRFERGLIERALGRTRGNQKEAARLLGINATTLHAMLKRHDIRAGDFKRAPRRLTVVGDGSGGSS